MQTQVDSSGERTGQREVFVSPYHAWTYGRDGEFFGARLMDRTEGFRPEERRLPSAYTKPTRDCDWPEQL